MTARSITELAIGEEFTFRGMNTRLTRKTTMHKLKHGVGAIEVPAFATEQEIAPGVWAEWKKLPENQKFRG